MNKNVYIFILFIILSIDCISKSDFSIALVLPSELQNPKSDIHQTIVDDITFWELLLLENKIRYSVIFQNELNSDLASKFSLIIIPTNTYFTQNQTEQIRFAINQGIGILSSGKLLIKDNEITSDFCENVFKVEMKFVESLDKSAIQYFERQNRILIETDFDLLLSTESDKKLYEVTDFRISAFGSIDGYRNLSKAFYGFIGEGRFAHFDFNTNQILSGSVGVNKFKKLILRTISWLHKDSGIWVASQNEFQYLVILDQTSEIPVKQEIKEYLEEKHIPVLLVSNEKISQNLNNLNIIGYAFDARFLEINSDSLISLILSTKTLEKFIILRENQFNYNELRKLSFVGIENVFIVNSNEAQFDEISNQLIYPITTSDHSSFRAHNLKYFYYPPKVNCNIDSWKMFLNDLELAGKNFEYFNREKIINNILSKNLVLKSRLSDNSLIISLSNKFNQEVRDVKLIIDNKVLKDAIVYEVSVRQKNLSIQKNKTTKYFELELPNISPNENIEIKVLFDKNL